MNVERKTASDRYGAQYYATLGGVPYERSDRWLSFFGRIADKIVRDVGPQTVLDAGCAMGFLVEALRDRGVEAYGIDVSEYALTLVRDDVKPWCRMASVTDPLDRDYDLIVCIEVLEHLAPEEAVAALDNLCAHTCDLLFSSTPDDFAEATHFNVRPPEYWAEELAKRGFLRDVDFDATLITHWAGRFRKGWVFPERTIGSYERRLVELRKENRVLRDELLLREARSHEAEDILRRLYSSRAYRYSRPLRAAYAGVDRLVRGVGGRT